MMCSTSSETARTQETQKLLAYGFRYFETHKLYSAGETLSTEQVWLGKTDKVTLTLANDLYLTLPRGSIDELQADIVTPDYPEAPIKAGDQVGTLSIRIGDEVLAERPLVAAQDVEEAGFFGRLFGGIKLFFIRLFA